MRYNKLIRDKIPEIANEKGQIVDTHTASKEEYEEKLKAKLQEEVEEFMSEPNKGELADILEVIHALSEFYGIDDEELEQFRRQKREERGGFKERLILDEVRE